LTPGYGFNIDAKTCIAARDVEKRERVLRYMLRPPLGQDRIKRLPDGRVRLVLKRPWSDGTTDIVHDPVDFVGKLAALVPRPGFHHLRYHGIFARRAKLRSLVCNRRTSSTSSCSHRLAEDKEAKSATSRPSRLPWAQLLKRTFASDVLECPKCHGRLQKWEMVTHPARIRAMLKSSGLPADSPRRQPPRFLTQAEMPF
jgi:hypothetical protein